MKLTDKAKTVINKNVRLKNLLALEFGCSVFSNNWKMASSRNKTQLNEVQTNYFHRLFK